DDFVRGQSFRGFKVEKYSDLKQRFENMIVLVSFGTFRDEVLQNIKKIASETEVLAPDVPVYGDGLFTLDYAKKHRKELEKVYNLLADEQSKKVFKNTVLYRITGKIDYLFEVETDSNEAYRNILKLNDNEVFCDLGAYNGDTVEEFLSVVNGYEKIYAFEPDKKNFKKLSAKFETAENIFLFNSALSEKSGEIGFLTNGGRHSVASENGEKIPCICVDDALKGEKATYIKFDVEGMENQAILGAKQTILNYKPKMLVSAYHKTDDYFSLPLLVNEIRDDYKIYMRHYKYIPAWDTQFYFI
ncbi:MAG: FkbM family methyltransferase, partial [Clostridia bacterium]|nr:FkbM family methyltransferase [Clostridia bacterium]